MCPWSPVESRACVKYNIRWQDEGSNLNLFLLISIEKYVLTVIFSNYNQGLLVCSQGLGMSVCPFMYIEKLTRKE